MTPVVNFATTNTLSNDLGHSKSAHFFLTISRFLKMVSHCKDLQIINLDFCTAPDYKPRIMKLFETIGDKRTLHVSWQVSHVLIKM